MEGAVHAVTARIGKLQKVPLRDIWPGEARGFTAWLAENLDLLGEALGLRLSLLAREGDVGPFAADIVAVDEGGGTVVTETQLERAGHDNLGKLLTYMVHGQPRGEDGCLDGLGSPARAREGRRLAEQGDPARYFGLPRPRRGTA